jgi:hypothetical protein
MNRTLLVGAIALCLLPLILLGPGLWKDIQSRGRWEIMGDLHVSNVSCLGRPYIFELCGYTISLSNGVEVSYIAAAAVGVDISMRPTAVLRSRTTQHVSLPMLASTSGLVARVSALLLAEFFVILVTLIARRDAREKNSLAADRSARRRADLIGLSRDRRDHF